MKIKIASWNINSIRLRIGLVNNWLKHNDIDILLLQETKCVDELFPVMDFTMEGYNAIFTGQKSYNGVAILSKYPIETEQIKLPLYHFDSIDEEARYIEGVCTINNKIIRVASVYVPNGSSALQKGEKLEDSKRFVYKLNFYKRLQQRMSEIKNYDEFIIVGGDANVARAEIDLHSPKTAEGGVGFHKLERNAFENILSAGYTEIFRHQHPTVQEYSWWDYRRNGWQNNKGWRIDYLLLNEFTLQNSLSITSAIDKSTRSISQTSDHVPVLVEIEI